MKRTGLKMQGEFPSERRTGPDSHVAFCGLRIVFTVAFVVICAARVYGQVNTEAYRKRPGDQGFSNRLGVNFSLYRGNSDFFKVNGRYRGDFVSGPLYAFLVLNYDYGEESKSIFLRDGFAHLRVVYAFGPRISGEAFAQKGFNDFIRLKDRVLGGAGGRLTIARGEDSARRYGLYLGMGGMIEREVEGKESVETTTTLFRSTNYLSGRYELTDRLSLSTVTYYQPAVTRFDDYRILLETGLEVDIFSGLAITTALNWRYDSDPFPGVESYDLTLSNGLALTF